MGTTALPPLLYEISNFLLWTIGVMLSFVFFYYMVWKTLRLMDVTRQTGLIAFVKAAVNLTRNDVPFRAAVAVMVFVVGSVLKDGWSWLARYLDNTDKVDVWMLHSPWIFIPAAGAAIAIVGKLCMIRIYAPKGWGRLAYISAALISGGGALILWWLR